MRVVFVFCEGQHDVVFVQRCLGVHAGLTWVQRKISEYPTPLGGASLASGRRGPASKGFLEIALEPAHLGGMTLQAAGHPPIPAFATALSDASRQTWYLLLRTNGKTQLSGVREMLRRFAAIMHGIPAERRDIQEYAVAFLLDADDDGIDASLEMVCHGIQEVLPTVTSLEPGIWQRVDGIVVGCFVFHRDGETVGTLEDLLGPMAVAAWPARMSAMEACLDAHRFPEDPVSLKTSERWKALITAAGQFGFPGDPLSVVLGRNGLPPSVFETSATALALSSFLSTVPWRPVE